MAGVMSGQIIINALQGDIASIVVLALVLVAMFTAIAMELKKGD